MILKVFKQAQDCSLRPVTMTSGHVATRVNHALQANLKFALHFKCALDWGAVQACPLDPLM